MIMRTHLGRPRLLRAGPGREAEGGTWVSVSADGARPAAGTLSGRALIWDLAELRSELRARGLDP